MMTPLIVLANSWKHHDYCIAGINPETGKWVRPVSGLNDGRIPKDSMQLDGYFPLLLDVIEVPLADDGPDFGFERENRSILPGKWRLLGRATVADLMVFAETPRVILHNELRYVTIEDMQRKPFKDRATLQLIHVESFAAKRMQVIEKNYWSGILKSGDNTINPRITDPVYHERLNSGHPPSGPCLLTASLSMPWVPPGWKETKSPPCWKLIAGVIELPFR
ncbi:MAG: hypothetical protein HUU46_11605 [Candidatus Hydrogenedentes bacterium]|nr:hypothetical protein [Candidatus Hydrogenedentota bacterium]